MLTVLVALSLVVSPAMFDAQFLDYAAHIYAGEYLPESETANTWIVCTILRDALGRELAGISKYTLHPGRWNGWKAPTDAQRAFVAAVDCTEVPWCAFVGNWTDYNLWRRSYAADRVALVTGNGHGVVVCVPVETIVLKSLTMY